MTRKHFIIVVIFNFALALAFYVEGLRANVTDISGDLANIIPICKKLDNPSLFANDLYLNDIDNVKYYTPVFIETLRFFAKFTKFNYLQALNILGFITHFLYGVLWFLLFFSLRKDFWLAFIFSIFFRGVIWPPGMELLGISDIWTMMPRTVFIALIPLPFLICKYSTGFCRYLAPLVLGLLVNFHPISGVGCVLVYTSIYIFYLYFEDKLFLKSIKIQIFFYLMLVIVGMLPYVLSYFGNVTSTTNVNPLMFEEAFKARLSPVFFDAVLFLKSWFKPSTCFFGLGLIAFYFFDSSTNQKYFKIIFYSIIISLFFCNITIPAENVVNNYFNKAFRLSFQIVRAQKFVMILMQIATFLVFCELSVRYKLSDKFKIALALFYLLLISLSSSSLISKLPLFGEDITTFIFPNNLKLCKVTIISDDSDLLKAHNFINKNTRLSDVFYAQDVFFRTATNRAEVLDFHAAGMLIEGNPKTYTDFYFLFKKFKSSSEFEKVQILKLKKVNYIMVKEKWKTLRLVYQNAKYYIYKV